MKDRLLQLEALSRRLDPSAAEREPWLRAVNVYAEAFLERLPDGPTWVPDQGASTALDPSIAEAPEALESVLSELTQCVDTPGINPASGGHLGYIPGGGVFPSALGDFLADVTNRYAGVAFASPGAVRIEQALIDWMAGLIGYPPGSGGDLTSGGSMANLTAIVTAREALAIRSADIPSAPVYLTSQVHHCVNKALRVAGLAECPVRTVPMDDRYRMDVAALERMMRADRAVGLKPWLVVGSAGTTDTGAVDPITEIGIVARRERAWFHVDAAYGGFFYLCDEARHLLAGMDQADSVVMDPHKGLFLPYGTGALLVRDVHQLARAHGYEANYMQDARATTAAYSPADLSAELSRPFRGLRVWLPLKLFGLAPFRAALSEKIWLARYFHERLSKVDGFELGPAPDLSVVTYRYVPRKGDADEFNRRLMQSVLEDGRVFISSTRLGGHFVLRLAVLHFRTHRETVDHLLDLLERNAADLAGT